MEKNKLSEIISCYDSEKLYNFVDVVNKFKAYYGYSIDELEKLFKEYNILEWDFILNRLNEIEIKKYNIKEKENMYYVYLKSLSNLSIKGNAFIKLVSSLSNKHYNNIDLEKFGIYSCDSVLKGSDVKKILIVLFHLIKEFEEYLYKINLVDTYYIGGYSDFSLIYGGERIYPNSDLFVFEDEYDKNLFDKSSFVIKKKREYKLEN